MINVREHSPEKQQEMCLQTWNIVSGFMIYRRTAINTCIQKTSSQIQIIRKENQGMSTPASRKLESKIDLLKSELDIEDILLLQTERLYLKTCPSIPHEFARVLV
eukprot:TRINITY_DN4144_c0_g1_i1.p1 TRINITY_DN4144_c0_g1~~TRINITY_DN4144_c0_g1_i1.p1  ORF type:complete len:105 (-),score=18.67 TRINITY_DN4144_c0_g1_i1:120-434(-)